MGRSLAALEEYEPEPPLGNGGPGPAGACFLDSIAALDLPGDGVGLNYHYGLSIRSRRAPPAGAGLIPGSSPKAGCCPPQDLHRPLRRFCAGCGAVRHRHPWGHSGTANRLHLFDVTGPGHSAPARGIDFDKAGTSPDCLTSFLYPDDSDRDGQLLRVYQQYFMVSARGPADPGRAGRPGLHPRHPQQPCGHPDQRHPSLHGHPRADPPADRAGPDFDQAVEQVEKTCAYTNHTILAEALEKWPLDYIQTVAPQIVAHHPGAGPARPPAQRQRAGWLSWMTGAGCTWPTWTSTTATR